MGYAAGHLAALLEGRGWSVTGTTRDGRGGTLRFDDRERVMAEITAATHILSSVPPEDEVDPVLVAYGTLLAHSDAWLGYLSSTGVYGDAGGAWVDETAPIGSGRRAARAAADADWQALGARVFRLPGIYGPGRSPIDRVRAGRAHRVGLLGQVFSRVHIADIVSGVIAGFDGPAGAYNLADDFPCDQDAVVSYAATLAGLPPPPLVPLESLSAAARGFYAENRRVANGKAKRVLNWRPLYPNYRLGLRALSAMTSPSAVTPAPALASSDQR
ncbi:NAD(P)-dependent oxidoreductase [Sphingomonas paucimobilis]|nr:epimerase [Sphingomonas paucimobilis]MBQ1481787.1 NAD(P)-dependent oxidoreductase [Sphingomonas sp.]RSU65900.1 NAD(P)-dependent oxidoreductase [Sphingomonas sp. S-NIH.Pt1_0416]NNG56225.1 NAD(P)-dependent oxidoreductase [Sphingomonas paucimobilis]QBE94132.1 NAD(P)-dependent oxidoreductase [Sphingomonas paucimobilis]QPS18254.1 NAD(P)-dependent oxidoreductase [Sphingomonas paucimobilis]